MALDFLREVYEEMLLLGLNSSVSPRMDLVIPMILDTLVVEGKQEVTTLPQKHFLKVRKALHLLKTANCDDTFKLEVRRKPIEPISKPSNIQAALSSSVMFGAKNLVLGIVSINQDNLIASQNG